MCPKPLTAADAMPSYPDVLPAQEALLVDVAKRFTYHKEGRFAVCLHLSKLRDDMRTQTQVSVAARKARDLAHRYEGEVFHLYNDDLVVTLKDPQQDLLEDVVRQICHIFKHDPLVAKRRDEFFTTYSMADQADAFLDFAKIVKHVAETGEIPVTGRPKHLDVIDPGKVRTAVGTISVEPCVERSQIYALEKDASLRPHMGRISMRASAVEEVMLEGVDLDSQPHLREHAAKRMELGVVAASPHLSIPWPMPWMCCVGLDTLLSIEFMQFDRDWQDKWQNPHMLPPSFAVSFGESFERLDTYKFARGFVVDQGYALCLQELSLNDLANLTNANIEADSYLIGAPDQNTAPRQWLPILHGWLSRFDADAVILDGCNDEQTLDAARDSGVGFVAGTFADAVYAGERSWAAA